MRFKLAGGCWQIEVNEAQRVLLREMYRDMRRLFPESRVTARAVTAQLLLTFLLDNDRVIVSI